MPNLIIIFSILVFSSKQEKGSILLNIIKGRL